MGGFTRVDIASLRLAQPRVEEIATSVLATLTTLQGTLDAEGSCWGNDETGRTFDAAYRPAVATVHDGFTELGSTVEAIARALSVVADRAEAVDGRTASRMA
jgi:uncharacterized protein YukE